VATRPLILLHGYSADGHAFNRWRSVLQAAGWRADQLHTVSYESLSNEVSVRDIAEGFDKLLQQQEGLANGEPFDVMVHSTGMLVLRAWLTRRGVSAERRARLKHLIALAPATFGSPLAHKGRSFLGALVKGRKGFGPDFLEAGDQVLDALELGSRFSWELAHVDLFGTECFYDTRRATPYVFVFCGARGYRGVSAMANSAGTDGTVRWAGCALNSRKLVLDLTADCAEEARVQLLDWTQDDVPMYPIANTDHGSILSNPPVALQQMVIDALRVTSRPLYDAWVAQADATVAAARGAMVPWQQFLVRAVDERGDGVADWNLQLGVRNGATLTLDGLGRTLTFAVKGEDTLSLLDQGGKPIAGSAPVTLVRADSMESLRDATGYTGTFTYMADAPSFRECGSGQTYNVLMSGAYKTVERAYTAAKLPPGSGQQIEVTARFKPRPDTMEGPKERDVIEFVKYVGPAANPDCR
jgi:pimeloyl-ACP methyl ester carboxylesterase